MSIEALQTMIDQSRHIVFFGGAGVSTESGLKDFRSEDGLYSQRYQYPPETMLSHTFFMAHPDEFYSFYRDKLLCPDVRPNAAHIKLAEMERAGRLAAVVTQNIDGLHQMAGSRNVMELHGSVHRSFCMKCRRSYDLAYIQQCSGVPRCECGGIIKPDVVLYEEPLDSSVMDAAIRAISDADMLIVGGTSLAVYPAAGLIDYYPGDRLALINKSSTPYDRRANLRIEASIGQTLSQIKV
jgi:NAD-dependent deacetylase